MKWITKHLIFFVVLLQSSLSYAKAPKLMDFQVQGQIYPTGILSSLHFERAFASRDMIGVRIGYNLVRHRDLGVHDDERGGGFGFSLEYSRYLKKTFQGFYGTLRTSFWFNELDWQDIVGQNNQNSGTTNVKVLQPTIEIGHTWEFKNHLIIKPSLGLGFEINVDTDGAEVGQGLIGLIGVSIGWRLRQ